MSDKYHGQVDDRRYSGEDVDVTYSLKRCIHARECVMRLNAVFDVQKRPWIQPDNADANALVAVVARCPSGALHTERKDDGEPEGVPAENVIIVHENSYYQFIGDLVIESSNVEIAQETRAALCRCGMSGNKPFCDNSHREGFMAPSSMVRVESEKEVPLGGKLLVRPHENGSIEVKGNFELRDEAGNVIYRGTSTWLCRCGHSNTKPFCDSTHKKIGFRAP